MKILAPAAILLVTATLAGAVLQPIRNGLLENNLRGGTNRIVEVADPIDPLDVVNYQTFLGASASDWLALTNRPTFPSWNGPAGVSSNGVNGEVYIGTNVPAGGAYDDGWTNSLGDLAWLDSVSNAPPLNWAGPAGVVSQAVDGVVYIGTNTPAGGSTYDDSWTNGITPVIYGDYAGITNPPAIPGAYDDGWTNDLGALAFEASETDPIWSAASNAVTTQAAQGATAYGWGDHGTNGYLTSAGGGEAGWKTVLILNSSNCVDQTLTTAGTEYENTSITNVVYDPWGMRTGQWAGRWRFVSNGVYRCWLRYIRTQSGPQVIHYNTTDGYSYVDFPQVYTENNEYLVLNAFWNYPFRGYPGSTVNTNLVQSLYWRSRENGAIDRVYLPHFPTFIIEWKASL